MSSQTAIGSGSTKNRGGTIFGAGNFTSGNITNSFDVLENAAGKDDYGTSVTLAVEVASSGNLGTVKPVSAGTFAYNAAAANTWIMKRQSTTIGGVANTLLQSGGERNLPDRMINDVTTYRRLDEHLWFLPSGTLEKGSNAGAEATLRGYGGATPADSAANPTRAIPGEFCYLVTGKTPEQADYAPRTG